MSLPPNARDAKPMCCGARCPRLGATARAHRLARALARRRGCSAILKKQKQKEREVRLLMLGLDNAGKTTVVKKFNGQDIDLIPPTLGFNIETLEYRGFKLNIWDVGGQTSLRSYWRNYFEQTDGLIWVVDSADRARLHDCRAELEALLQQEVRTPRRHLRRAARRERPTSAVLTRARASEARRRVSAHFRQQAGHRGRAHGGRDTSRATARRGREAPLANRELQCVHRQRACIRRRLDRTRYREPHLHARLRRPCTAPRCAAETRAVWANHASRRHSVTL